MTNIFGVNVKYFTLSQICKLFETRLKQYGILNSKFRVLVEINKIRIYQSGSCFLELVEKEGKEITAQMDGIIFASDFRKIDRNFRKIKGEPLKEGIQLLLYSQIIYSPKYGLRLKILDVSYQYLYGQLYLQRQETIKRLKQLGIFDKNKSLKLPLLPFNIAVISTDSSKGFNDFKQIILKSGYNINFDLFEVVLQGEKAYTTIINQLEKIKKGKIKYDVIAIIRGGGGDSTLIIYDDFDFAKYIANYPIPIFTGIGHSTNQTIVEMVANKNFITPTDLANYIVKSFSDIENQLSIWEKELNIVLKNKTISYKDKFKEWERYISSVGYNILNNFVKKIDILENNFKYKVFDRINFLKGNLDYNTKILSIGGKNYIYKMSDKINILETNLKMFFKNYIQFIKNDLNVISNKLDLLSVEKILKKGYAILFKDKKVIKSVQDIKKGEELEVRLYDGKLKVKVEDIFED